MNYEIIKECIKQIEDSEQRKCFRVITPAEDDD